MSQPLRLAIIGTGRWGSNIIATLQTLPQCSVVATATHDYATLLTRTDLDGVVIATPATTHAAIASECISAGIPVFIEKPFTTNVADAEQLIDLSKKHGASIFVGHVDLYNSAYRAMKAKLDAIGTITHVLAEAGSNGGARDDVSVLWDWTPHSVALVLDVLNKFPVKISATGEPKAFPASVTLDLSFEAGVTAHIENSWTFPAKRRRLTVTGAHGTLVYDDMIDTKTTPPLTAELTVWLASLATKTPLDATLAKDVIRVLETAARMINGRGE